MRRRERNGGWRRSIGAAIAVALASAAVACTTTASGGVTVPADGAGRAVSAPPAVSAPTPPPTPPGPSDTPAAPRLLIGAHYYVWFPQNLGGGVLGDRLLPRRGPDQSYRSDDPARAERAIDAAHAAGVDFFTLDYWPNRPDQNRNIDTGFLPARNLGAMRFAMFYETQDLGFDKYHEATPMNATSRARLVADMTAIADRYFANPSYLRLDGRPVVFLYLTRSLTGDVARAVADVRAALRARGHDVFLVGDEIFWRVTTTSGGRSARPQVDRARLFDAVTAYNLYDGDNRAYAGYPSTTRFFPDAAALYARYRAALGPSVPVIPSVIPGYNDRGTRPAEGHYAIPRQYRPGDDNGSTLVHMLESVAAPLLDQALPMALVTSWNEWNEDTAIEPMPTAAPTSRDTSSTGTFFTQGYAYGGPGTPELDALRDFLQEQRGVPAAVRGHR